jgi:hypothetical protein
MIQYGRGSEITGNGTLQKEIRLHPNKIDLREIGWGGVNWIDLAQDRDQWGDLVNTVMNLRVP